MSLDKQLEAVWDVIQDRGLLKGVGDDLWDEIKADIGSKLTRPIPTTRTQEVAEAIEALSHYDHHYQKNALKTKHGFNLMAYIAKLEASQPKPQSDEGLREALIAHRDAARMHIHNCAVRYKKEGKAWDGEFVMREMQAAMRISDAALSRPAPVPTRSEPFPSPAVSVEQIVQELETFGDDFDGGTAAGATFHLMASRLKEVLTAPVPTSGAVEVAIEIMHKACKTTISGFEMDTTKAAATIQQYGDACRQQGRNDAVYVFETEANKQLRQRIAELEATPPAADGKLRGALENSRWYVEQFISHTVEKYAGRVLPSNPVKSRVLHDLDVGDSDVLAASLKNEIELAQCLLKEVGAALAQPASGGGE